MKLDTRTLCENALKYYRQSGAQYREAARLWYYAKTKVFIRDNFLQLLTKLPPLTLNDLGLDKLLPGERGNNPFIRQHQQLQLKKNAKILLKNKRATSSSDLLVDNQLFKEEEEYEDDDEVYVDGDDDDDEEKYNPEQMLLEAYRNLGFADHEEKPFLLTLSRPPSTAFTKLLRQQRDGSTSLGFVNPTSDLDSESQYTLSHLVGKLSEGTASLPPFKELESNLVKVLQFIPEAVENPFASHLPLFDSSRCGASRRLLDLEDSSMVLNAFGQCDDQCPSIIQR